MLTTRIHRLDPSLIPEEQLVEVAKAFAKPDHVVLIDAGRLVRAARLGTLTGETGTLLVEVDGDVEAYCAALVAQGLVVQRDLLRVLVELPNGDDAESVARVFATHDIVRDVAVATGVGLLRLERRRGHLEDLFAGATT